MKLTFCCCDLALDPMTFTSELDLDMIVTYLHAKNFVNRSSGSKAIIREKKETNFWVTCDPALNPMTFTSELDLDMVVTYLHAKNQVKRSSGSEVIIRKRK